MDEELKPELQNETQTQTITSEDVKTELDSLPRLEDLLKSEKEVSVKQEIKGVTNIDAEIKTEDRVFAKKQDKRKALVKTRLKIVTGVYIAVASLLFAFVGVNIATLVILNKDITNNANTIQAESYIAEQLESSASQPLDSAGAPIEISLNEPRDYSDDKKELTFLDKLTILFRNIFG